MKERIESLTNDIKNELEELSLYIYNNPELGYDEYKSSKAHVELLRKHRFEVEEGYLGMDTAFKAVYKGQKTGPTVGYLAEYDALPGIGHGCGHNILGAVSTGAGIVLSKLVDEIGGNIVVFGTPAEETSGAKVRMTDMGAFDKLDVAMSAHPDSDFSKSGSSLALEAIQFTFRGKTAHAAAAPEKGINALDACLATFHSINALRQHTLPEARIHGIIRAGGEAANIVPELAIAEFYVRTTNKHYLIELSEKVKNCARAGALAAGAQLEITNYEESFDNLVTNKTLQDTFVKNLGSFGITNVKPAEDMMGSTDVGNVSQVCPTIHPKFGICEEGIVIPVHTREFAEATLTETAKTNVSKTVMGLAMTAVDIIVDGELLEQIKKEFKEARK
ncbi:MAG: M20 family metallopeptidase [Eubacteriales bacterium]|nr:M20 family metallopeptidase [Eubacteriales bacterium]